MMKKLINASVMAIIAGSLLFPAKSVACDTSCTLISRVCINQNQCGGFPTMYLLLNCNGQQVLCPVGCCG